MASFLLVAKQVVILFALMGFGVFARKTTLVRDESMDGIVNLLILLVTPCLIVDCFQRPFDPTMLQGLALAFVIAVVAHVAVIAASRLLVRHRDPSTRRPLLLASVFSNAGFMGIPLEQALLGDRGVFFGAVYIVVFNLFMWSWGLKTMSEETATHGNRIRMFVNPGTIGIAAGLPLFLLSCSLPEVVAAPIHQMASLNTPLAMFVIGYTLAGAKLGRVIRMPAVYVSAAIRLLGYPLSVIFALYALRAHLDRDMALALSIASAAPTAAMVSMFAAKFRRDVDTSVALVTGTTLLSVVTIPFVIGFVAFTLFPPVAN